MFISEWIIRSYLVFKWLVVWRWMLTWWRHSDVRSPSLTENHYYNNLPLFYTIEIKNYTSETNFEYKRQSYCNRTETVRFHVVARKNPNKVYQIICTFKVHNSDKVVHNSIEERDLFVKLIHVKTININFFLFIGFMSF